MSSAATRTRYDAVVVGGGHNGLVAAAYLGRAGRSVLVLERAPVLGGAAVSTQAFPGVEARLSRYAYLVSLLPQQIVRDLGLRVELRRRRISSYTPMGDGGLLVDSTDRDRTRASMRALTGSDAAHDGWEALQAATGTLARAVFPTLLEPLRRADDVRRIVEDDETWEALVERPLGETLDTWFADDVVRGVVLTDALIGTFAGAHDRDLRQNRCFLYHVIGGGTGDWDVPVGGMGAVTRALAVAAYGSGAAIRTRAEVTAVAVDDDSGEVRWLDGDGIEQTVTAGAVLAGVAPAVLDRLLEAGGSAARTTTGDRAPEGAQLKINMLLSRLPRLRESGVDPREAFAGTFHVGESAAALQAAYDEASAGKIPSRPPSEIYCHSLTDPSILGEDLLTGGAHTLTLFGLHMPTRLFAVDHDAAKVLAVDRTLAELDRHLAEPIADCLLHDLDGRPCIEARTPPELEAELGLAGGHIFHRDLQWPWAESDDAAGGRPGEWGVETDAGALLLCGAGARRGGGVSGVPGHNAARAFLRPA